MNPFTKDTTPNLFERPSFGQSYHAGMKATRPTPLKDALPARDSRYPAYASGNMMDGRFVTDYRPQCSKNIPTGQQFYTKRWMIEHGEELMKESRKRHMEGTGATLPMANTIPPPAARIYSTPFESDVQKTNLKGGIGVERVTGSSPELFGTFSYEPSIAEIQTNRKQIALTTTPEGGRNTVRGFFQE